MHHDAQSLPHQIFDFDEPPEKRIQIIKIRKIQKFKRTKYWFREVDSFRAPQRLNYILEKMTTETRFRANSLTSNGSSRPSTPNGSILYDLLTQKETRKTTKIIKIGSFSKMTEFLQFQRSLLQNFENFFEMLIMKNFRKQKHSRLSKYSRIHRLHDYTATKHKLHSRATWTPDAWGSTQNYRGKFLKNRKNWPLVRY